MGYKFASTVYKHYPAIAAALIVLAGIGGFLLYQIFQPHYRTEMVERVSYKYRGSFEHKAEVVENNRLWPVGCVLENRPAYFLHVTPKLDVVFRYVVVGASSAQGELRLDADLVISAEGETLEYWSNTVDLGEAKEDLSERAASLEFELDLPRINERIENTQVSLKFPGGSIEVKAVVTSVMEGEIGGREVDSVETYEMPIQLGRFSYIPGSELSREETVTKPVTRRVREEVPTILRVLSILLIVVPALGLGYVTVRRWGLNESELRRLRAKHERERYDEWISKGELPDLDAGASVELESLEDLVDAAVDMGLRIIYDEEKSIYFFIQEGVLYCIKPRESDQG